MSVEVAVTIACNLSCDYCYQNPMREAGNFATQPGYDLDAIKTGLWREGTLPEGFTLFGGEPLLMPIEDLEELWRWGLERYGRNSIQTNGTLFTPAHLALVKRYRVGVGISMDGPGELNDSRWAGDATKTVSATVKSLRAIEDLCAQGTPPSIITTLYRGNTGDRLPALLDWFTALEGLGVPHVNLHVLEVDDPIVRERMALSTDDLLAAMRAIFAFSLTRTRLKFAPFDDMVRLLLGQDERASCIWGACDPYTTSAVHGIDASGGRSNCGRTNKEGVAWHKGDRAGHERQVALYHTPQEFGGCKDCRFFLQCKGQCPGTSIDGDWRNRSEHCAVWFGLLEDAERQIVRHGSLPLSLSPFRPQLEAAMLEVWAAGRTVSVHAAVEWLASEPVGRPSLLGALTSDQHGDVAHGDEHGDAPHGDHTDTPGDEDDARFVHRTTEPAVE